MIRKLDNHAVDAWHDLRSNDLRDCERAIRQIESDNAEAAIARAMREIQHDNYRLRRLLDELGYDVDNGAGGVLIV